MQRTWAPDRFAWDDASPMPHKVSDFRLYKGDCAELYGEIPARSVDLLLTDPPYGTTRNGWDSKEFRETLEATWREWLRVVKPSGAIVVMSASPFDKILAMSQLSLYRYEWIWNKNKATGHLNSRKIPMKAHENVLVFYQQSPTYHPQETLGHAPSHAVNAAKVQRPEKLRNYGHHDCLGNPGGKTSRLPRTILNIPVHNNDDEEKWHPTQKPVKLMEFFVRTYTNEGETVFDPYMGSATTGVAALKCGRKFLGIEIDEDYFRRGGGAFVPVNSLKRDMVVAVEAVIEQSLDGHSGRSNVKTSILHGAIEKYINHRRHVAWEHEKTIRGNEQSFKIDIYATGKARDMGLLLKAPARSLAKNKKNNLVNSWGEAVRVAIIRRGETKPLNVLSIQIYPTTDIIVSKKNQRGGGETKFSPYVADSPETYNAGYSMLAPGTTRFRYVAVPYEFCVAHTLKRLDRVLRAFRALPTGRKIRITKGTWQDFDQAIDWMLDK